VRKLRLGVVAVSVSIAILLSGCAKSTDTQHDLKVANDILNAKYTSHSMSELQTNYEKFKNDIDSQLFTSVFDVKSNSASIAVPDMNGIASFKYVYFDSLNKVDSDYDYVFVMGTLQSTSLNEEEAPMAQKIVAKFTFKSGKLVDYTEL
jgi:hypothetical protein